jgi:translation initiation factor 1
MNKEYKIVYSDDPAELKKCKKCGRHPCCCPQAKDFRPDQYTLKVRLEKNGRGGKLVTVVFELPASGEAYFGELVKKLKSMCGAGGSFKDNSIEIQGDHREKIKSHLEKVGFKVKLAGG